MAVNETKVTGKKYRVWDNVNSIWKRLSFWTKSEDVEMGDGNSAETNLGAIKGITSSLSSTSANYALSASAGKSLQDSVNTLNTNLSKIGNCYVSTTENTSIGNGTTPSIGAGVTISENGNYLLIADAAFSPNSYGYRAIYIGKDADVTGFGGNYYQSVSGATMNIQRIYVASLAKGDLITVNVAQTSGSSLTVSTSVICIKISK